MKLPFIIVTAVLMFVACNPYNKKGKIPAKEELTNIKPASPWGSSGSHPEQYMMGADSGKGPDGSHAGTIVSIVEETNGFGTLMQGHEPGKYLGKKIRMSGYMKSKEVNGWAGFWLRIDKDSHEKPLSFDNMEDRAIEGTTEWKKYEITLDVPAEANYMAYGALLAGTGQVWFDNVVFEVLDSIAPITKPVPYSPPAKYFNLDFDLPPIPSYSDRVN